MANKPYRCPNCQAEFKTEEELGKHMEAKHQMEPDYNRSSDVSARGANRPNNPRDEREEQR